LGAGSSERQHREGVQIATVLRIRQKRRKLGTQLWQFSKVSERRQSEHARVVQPEATAFVPGFSKEPLGAFQNVDRLPPFSA
jgi:hypothetical protein